MTINPINISDQVGKTMTGIIEYKITAINMKSASPSRLAPSLLVDFVFVLYLLFGKQYKKNFYG